MDHGIVPFRRDAMSRGWKILCLVLFVILAFGGLEAQARGPFARLGHAGMVAASGIRPANVGSYEGVGRSTRSFEAARNVACYWGQRQPVSIQYSKRGAFYYAVVRYR